MTNNLLRYCFFYLTLFLSVTSQSQAQDVTIAVASNFKAPVAKITSLFEEQTQHKVNLVFGSSGKLYAQIRQGAPFDIFLSADSVKPRILEKNGFGVKGSRFAYAFGTLALWSPNPDMLPNKSLKNEALITGNFKTSRPFHKMAIANPKLAPYGQAARDVLEEKNQWQKILPTLVMGENIAQTYQFVASGNAEIGFVALSQIMANGELTSGSVWVVPPEKYRPIRQVAILLKSAQNNQAAKAFLQFLRSEPVQEIIRSYGYKTPMKVN